MTEDQQPGRLKRELGVFHAVMLGLGSILGTGVFVSIGIAAGIAGPSVLVAIVLAGLLALCNGLSSAQLAAAHPVAGGTYEYGYRFLHPKLGFSAGWMFLLAKSASAATAALGVAEYVTWHFLAQTEMIQDISARHEAWIARGIAFAMVAGFTLLVMFGLRRSAWVNALFVSVTLLGLLLTAGFAFWGTESSPGHSWPSFDFKWLPEDMADYWDLLAATALMFVAYTGYGRIATLGEEVRRPRRTIPIAIVATLAAAAILYFLIGLSFAYTVHADPKIVNHKTALLAMLWYSDAPEWLLFAIAIAAITAMLGVLLNLVLGLSRVLLAMGRRHDVYPFFAKVNASGTTPVPAVIGVGVLVAGLTLIGDVKTTWSFSAFTVLVYYGITNLAALRLPVANRLYPRAFSWAGLGGCLFLCWWVEPVIWLVGLGLIAGGLVWHGFAPRWFGRPAEPHEVCTQCGYDLRASVGSCPECGAVIPKPSSNVSTDGS